jgi:hypothetical protein
MNYQTRLLRKIYKQRIYRFVFQVMCLMGLSSLTLTRFSGMETLGIIVLLIFVFVPDAILDILILKTKLNQFDSILAFSDEMQNEIKAVREAYELLGERMASNLEASSDSIKVEMLKMISMAKSDNVGACAAVREANREFDFVMMLKRKSLPIDEVLLAFHKDKKL